MHNSQSQPWNFKKWIKKYRKVCHIPKRLRFPDFLTNQTSSETVKEFCRHLVKQLGTLPLWNQRKNRETLKKQSGITKNFSRTYGNPDFRGMRGHCRKLFQENPIFSLAHGSIALARCHLLKLSVVLWPVEPTHLEDLGTRHLFPHGIMGTASDIASF